MEESLTQRRRGDETATTTKATTNARGTTRGDDETTASEELRQMLIERDARLGMLRSKLDMVERENENLKRNGASASGDGGGGARGGAGEVNYGAVGGGEWGERSRGADVDERGERRGEGGGAGFKAAVGDASIEVGV